MKSEPKEVEEIEQIVDDAIMSGFLTPYETSSAKKWLTQKLIQYGEERERRVREAARKEVGFLRQWLNEDRITDKKFVTNEEILTFLPALKENNSTKI